MSDMSAFAVEWEALDFSYAAHVPPVLSGVSARVEKGRIFAILGPNGCGKTTLLKLLLGVLKPARGEVRVWGRFAFVPQLFQVSFPFKVLDMVLMGRARQIGLFSLPSRADEAAAREALARLDLTDLAERSFDELSGGQRQLVIFARALASGAEILVLDEPTSALDMKNQELVLGWLTRLRNEGMTVIFTTHHPQHAQAIADDALLMFSPAEYACGPMNATLSEENLQRLYKVELRRVTFEHRGKTWVSLVPVHECLPCATAFLDRRLAMPHS